MRPNPVSDDTVAGPVVPILRLLGAAARPAAPGGTCAVVAENVLIKHQLLILNRRR
jgi:hypothetical protein